MERKVPLLCCWRSLRIILLIVFGSSFNMPKFLLGETTWNIFWIFTWDCDLLLCLLFNRCFVIPGNELQLLLSFGKLGLIDILLQVQLDLVRNKATETCNLTNVWKLHLFLGNYLEVSLDYEMHFFAIRILRDYFILWKEHLVLKLFNDKVDCKRLCALKKLVLDDCSLQNIDLNSMFEKRRKRRQELFKVKVYILGFFDLDKIILDFILKRLWKLNLDHRWTHDVHEILESILLLSHGAHRRSNRSKNERH